MRISDWSSDVCSSDLLPFVAVDNYRGAYAMTEALLTAGARQVVHIAGPKHNRDARDRPRGFVDAMTKTVKERKPGILPGDFSEERGEKAARLFVEGQKGREHV